MDLRDRIRLSFERFFEAHGFHEDSYNVSEKFFGNAIFVLRSSAYYIRFVTDRGDLLIDIAPSSAPEDWGPMDFALEILGHPQFAMAGLSDTEIAAILSREHVRLAELFCVDNLQDTRSRLEELANRPRPYRH